jgi:hypothetical protein
VLKMTFRLAVRYRFATRIPLLERFRRRWFSEGGGGIAPPRWPWIVAAVAVDVDIVVAQDASLAISGRAGPHLGTVVWYPFGRARGRCSGAGPAPWQGPGKGSRLWASKSAASVGTGGNSITE